MMMSRPGADRRLNGKLAKKCFKMLQNALFTTPLTTQGEYDPANHLLGPA